MDNKNIAMIMQTCYYRLKPETKSSYYWEKGSRILPNRISAQADLFSPIKRSSNTLHPTIGEFKAQFTKKEDSESPLMQHIPYQVHTKIRSNPDYPQFIGYGTCGISNENGHIKDTGDLMIFYSSDNWETLKILYFKEMGNPNNIDEAFRYATTIV